MKIKKRKQTQYVEIDITNTGITDWCDKDHMIFTLIMKMVEMYVEEEDPFDILDWEWDDAHREAKKELQSIYRFWKHYHGFIKRIEDKYLEVDTFDLYDHYEQLIQDLEYQFMIRAINVRGFMWT